MRIGQNIDTFEGGWTKTRYVWPAIIMPPQLDLLCMLTKFYLLPDLVTAVSNDDG